MELISGRLDLSFTDPSNTTLKIGDNLHNGDWHQLDITVIGESGLIAVELRVVGNNIGFLPVQQNITLSPDALLYGPVLLGSVTDTSPSLTENPASFTGCMRMLYINENAVNLDVNNASYALTQPPTPGCSREENCYPDPCANDGECMSTWNDFSCSCLTDFTSTNCSECELFCCTNCIPLFMYSPYAQLLQHPLVVT